MTFSYFLGAYLNQVTSLTLGARLKIEFQQKEKKI